MPIKILSTGQSVTVDVEDWDLASEREWYVFPLCPSNKPAACAKQRRLGREFKLFLHREIAARMDPSLIGRRFRVVMVNGDYMDCRRENLNVVVAKKKVGRPKKEPRPMGFKYREHRGSRNVTREDVPTSELWAGGYEYLLKNRERQGEGYRVRKCIAGKPID